MWRVMQTIGLLSVLAWGGGMSAAPVEATGIVVDYAYQPAADSAVPRDTAPALDVERSGLRLHVDGDNLLVSFPQPSDEPNGDPKIAPLRLLYLGDAASLVLLDDQGQTYSYADPEILTMLDRHLDQQDTDLRVRLLELPHQPRRVMANTLEREAAARAALRWEPWEMVSTGTWQEQAGYRSLGYEAKLGDVTEAEVWVAPVDETPVDVALLATIRRASGLTDVLLKAASEMTTADPESVFGFAHNPLAAFAFQHGLPVHVRRFGAGAMKYEKILTTIRARQGDDEPVEIPAGYRQRTLGPQ